MRELIKLLSSEIGPGEQVIHFTILAIASILAVIFLLSLIPGNYLAGLLLGVGVSLFVSSLVYMNYTPRK